MNRTTKTANRRRAIVRLAEDMIYTAAFAGAYLAACGIAEQIANLLTR